MPKELLRSPNQFPLLQVLAYLRLVSQVQANPFRHGIPRAQQGVTQETDNTAQEISVSRAPRIHDITYKVGQLHEQLLAILTNDYLCGDTIAIRWGICRMAFRSTQEGQFDVTLTYPSNVEDKDKKVMYVQVAKIILDQIERILEGIEDNRI